MATATAVPQTAAKPRTPFMTLVLCSMFLLLVAYTFSGPSYSHKAGHLRVFGSFWSSGWNLTHHENPYAPGPLSWHPYSRNGVEVVDVNTYPPVMLPFFQWLSRFNPNSVYRVWDYLSALAFILCIVLLRGRWYHVAWFALCAPVIDSFATAQIYPLLALLFVAAWLLLKSDRQVAAGILIGFLVALKPNFGLWPLFLFFTAYRRSAIYAVISCAFFSLAPLLLYGPHVYAEWLSTMFSLSGDNHFIFPTNIAIPALMESLGHKHIGQLIAIALISVSLYSIIRKRADLATATGLALSLGILASPVGWIHYTIFLASVLFSFAWSKRFACSMLTLLFPATIACGPIMNHAAAALIMRCAYMLPIAALWILALRGSLSLADHLETH